MEIRYVLGAIIALALMIMFVIGVYNDAIEQSVERAIERGYRG